MEEKKKFYCGDEDKIPDKYSRRGSRYECLKKGVGVGLYIVNKEKEEKKKNESELLYEEGEKKELKELKVKKIGFKKFFDDNFQKAKKISKQETDIFYKLARMYVDSKKT